MSSGRDGGLGWIVRARARHGFRLGLGLGPIRFGLKFGLRFRLRLGAPAWARGSGSG